MMVHSLVPLLVHLVLIARQVSDGDDDDDGCAGPQPRSCHLPGCQSVSHLEQHPNIIINWRPLSSLSAAAEMTLSNKAHRNDLFEFAP